MSLVTSIASLGAATGGFCALFASTAYSFANMRIKHTDPLNLAFHTAVGVVAGGVIAGGVAGFVTAPTNPPMTPISSSVKNCSVGIPKGAVATVSKKADGSSICGYTLK